MNLDLLDSKVIVLAAALIVIAAVLVWLYVRNRRRTTAGLRQKFGSEYDRAVLTHGSGRKAESKLEDREKRVEKLKIRDLDPNRTRTLFEEVGVCAVSLCRFSKGSSHRS